jgi:hypothetical protein
MQIIANRMPFAVLHTLQASRATPNLQHWQFTIHQTLFAPSLAAQQPRKHLTFLCLNFMHGKPFS